MAGHRLRSLYGNELPSWGVVAARIVSAPSFDRLEEWGAWLDALLTTGLACPTAHIHRQIEAWCVDAETLGDQDNSAKARALSSPGLSLQQRKQLLLDLLLEQDMSVRLLQLEWLAFHHRSLEN